MRKAVSLAAGIAGGGIILLVVIVFACLGGAGLWQIGKDAKRPARVEACRAAAEREHVKWYYTDAEGCVGEGVFGVHVPLDIDSPEFQK